MKRILFILCFLLGGVIPVEVVSAAEQPQVTDSVKFNLLHKLNHTQPGDSARLAIYHELSRISQDTQTAIYYADKLLKEAEKQKNSEYICRAYYTQLVLAFNSFDTKGVNTWYALLEPTARKAKQYDLLFRGKRGYISMLNITGDFEQQEKEALKMLEEARDLKNDVGMITAYQCLSHAYRSTFRGEEAAKVLEKGCEIAYRIEDEDLILETNNLLINTYQDLKDQANILKWTQKLDRFLQKRITEVPALKSELRSWILLTYLAYLGYYNTKGDLVHANKYMKLAEEHFVSGYIIYDIYYYKARYDYYQKANMLNEALVELDIIIDLYQKMSFVEFGSMSFQKANILRDLGREDDALALYKRSFTIIDSLQVMLLNKQTEQLKKDFDTDQLLLSKEKMQRNIQFFFLSLVVLIIIIFLCFVAHTYYIRKGLRKSEEEMRQMAQEMELANNAKDVFLSTISTAISTPLNSVVEGSLKLALDEVTEKEERKKISKTLNITSANLLEMINNILNLSRLEAGMMKFKIEEVEIIPFVQGIAGLLRSKGKDIELSLPDTEGKVLKVSADIMRLQEVLTSTLAGSGKLELSIEVPNGETLVAFTISGSSLASYQEPPQEVVIANEVNRLLVEYFGGKYAVKANENNPVICFTLPLVP